MNKIFKNVKGTKDILPDQIYKWDYIEKKFKHIAKLYNFHEIKFPTFEYTELFDRSVGKNSDIFQKEMYTFEDKNHRSLTLRPEGTTSAMRLIMQNSLHKKKLPLKLFYNINNFRYEKPQCGRLREHHQLGIEYFGINDISAECELILFIKDFLYSLDFKESEILLNINSIGCLKCQPIFNELLFQYFDNNKKNLCPNCLNRLNSNPIRILDCKDKNCFNIILNSPKPLKHLCDQCNNEFNELINILENLQIKININDKLVRGLEYYNGIVFEMTLTNNNMAIIGGGRYDNLIKFFSKNEILPALGFGCGMERLIIAMDNFNKFPKINQYPDLYIGFTDLKFKIQVLSLSNELRNHNIIVDINISYKSINAQLKYANKIFVKYLIIIGEEEIKFNMCKMKDMKTSIVYNLPLESVAISKKITELKTLNKN